MTRHDLLTAVAAVLTTALETEPDPFPESTVYLAVCGTDIETWEALKYVLTSTGLVTCSGNCIHLTDKGRRYAVELEESRQTVATA
jgi:hypothetical protein